MGDKPKQPVTRAQTPGLLKVPLETAVPSVFEEEDNARRILRRSVGKVRRFLSFLRRPSLGCRFLMHGKRGGFISNFSEALNEAIRMLASFDPELYGIIFLSLRVTLTAIVFASLVGIPAGVLLGLSKFPGKAVLLNIVNAFMSLPPVVAGLVVYILLSNKTGLVGDRKLLFSVPAMCIAQFVIALPLMVGLSVSAVMQVDKQVLLTAKSLGAYPAQAAAVVVKEARFAIYSSFIVVFGRLMAEVGAVMMVGGNIRYQTRVMTTAIALNKGMGEFQTALALGMILLFLSFLVNGLLEALRGYGRVG